MSMEKKVKVFNVDLFDLELLATENDVAISQKTHAGDRKVVVQAASLQFLIDNLQELKTLIENQSTLTPQN